tara:strand:+ start:70 stop:219 length:150 start_codon:yes stop_codon:yes gene_type:complete
MALPTLKAWVKLQHRLVNWGEPINALPPKNNNTVRNWWMKHSLTGEEKA